MIGQPATRYRLEHEPHHEAAARLEAEADDARRAGAPAELVDRLVDAADFEREAMLAQAD